jgi:WD40 repeat protein
MRIAIRVILGVALIGLCSRLMLPTILELILLHEICPLGKPIDRFCMTSDGKVLIVASKASQLIDTWNLKKQTRIGSIRSPVGNWRALVISGTGTHIAWTEEPNNGVRVWELGSQVAYEFSTERLGDHVSISLNHDATMLAAGGNGVLRLWSLLSGEEKKLQAPRSGQIQDLMFSPDSKTLAAGSENSIELWSTETGEITANLPCRKQSRYVRHVVFSPSGRFLASSQWEMLGILVWDLPAGTMERMDSLPWLAEEDEAIIEFMTFSPDEKTLVASNGYRIGAWDVASGANFAEMGLGEQNWYRVQFGTGGRTGGPKSMASIYDASFTEDGAIRVVAYREDSILTRELANPRERWWLSVEQ